MFEQLLTCADNGNEFEYTFVFHLKNKCKEICQDEFCE